jgi:hypothetical protein
VLLAALLAFGLYANQHLRPGAEGIATPIAQQAAPNALLAVSSQPTVTPATLTPVAAGAPIALTVATPTPSAQSQATPVPAALTAPVGLTPRVVVLNVNPTPESESAEVTSTPSDGTVSTGSAAITPTVDPTAAAVISQAYERYWQVRAEALLDLDKTHLPEAMGGDHLASTAQLIDDLRAENRAIETQVDHDYRVIDVSDSSADVFDDYLSNSFYVDPATKEAITQPSSDELKVLYRLVSFDGVWKVVDSTRAE